MPFFTSLWKRCAPRKRKDNRRRQKVWSFEPQGERLEERAMLDGAPSLLDPPLPEMVVLPIWFESLAPHAVELQATLQSPNWIVQLSSTALANIHSPGEAGALFEPGGLHVLRGLGIAGQLLVQAPGQPWPQVQQWLASNPNFESYEVNGVIAAATVPNDPSFGETWGLNNTGQTLGLVDADIDAPEAWNITHGSSSVVVGVIDTGVDWDHPDLAANMWHNPGEIPDNGLDDDANGFVDDVYGYDFVNADNNPHDDNGHGTHVSGTIAAVGNNGIGVAGINWNSSIMALKFLDASGTGSTDDAVAAVNYVTMMRATYGINIRVTNNSWGGGGASQALYDAIAANRNADILFVAAAGNDGRNTDVTPTYPADYDLNNIISVAATDRLDALAWFSNYGAATVDIAAPGVYILSTWNNDGYTSISGTSMASPHVAGVAALAWAHSPLANWSQIKEAILAAADPLPNLAGQSVTGGRLNARRTLDLLRMNVRASDPAAGSFVATPPTSFTIDFTHDLDASSLQPGDLLINGVAATSVALADADTAVFQFATSPVVSQGPQSMLIVEGTILRTVDSAPIERWQQTFYYDAVPLQVIGSAPAAAQVVAAPSAILLDFNEAVAAGSIDISDLKLDFGTVTGATLIDSDTARYTVSGLVREGLVRYTLAAGAVTDAFGSPGAAYSGQFRSDDPEVETYFAPNLPEPIADNAKTLATLTVSDAFPLADLDVEVAISHPNVGDLVLVLIAPDGTRIELFNHAGGSGDNLTGLVLDDEAQRELLDAGAPFTGRFRPASALAAVDGFNVQGTWTLEISDDVAGFAGTLEGWTLVATRDITLAPRINSVQPLPADGSKTWLPIDTLTARFSEGMDIASVMSAANWKLVEAGADGNFDTPDDSTRALSVSPYTGALTATLNITSGELAPGKYRFTALSGGLRDVAGNLLDGNADGAGGDAYTRIFFVQPHVSSIPFVEDFESGFFAPPSWEFDADEKGSARIDSSLPHNGTSGLILEMVSAWAKPQTATLHLNLAGQAGLSLDFWQRSFGHSSPSVEDNVEFSADGINWHVLVNLEDYSKTVYQHYAFELDPAVAAAGIAYTRDFQIRFSQDNSYNSPGGYAFDDIRVSHLDFTAPRVMASAPTVTAGPVSSFTVTFSEPIDPTTFTAADITIASAYGPSIPVGDPVNSGDGRTFTIPLLSPQVVAGDYPFHIGPNVLDLAGNTMNQDGDLVSGETTQDDYEGILTIGPPIPQTIPYVQGFETSLQMPGWRFATVTGQIEVTSAGEEHGGSQHLLLTAANSNTSATREAVLVVDLAAYATATDLALQFWGALSASSSDLDLALSGDGITWATVGGNGNVLQSSLLNVYQAVDVDLDAELDLAGIARDGDVYIRLQNKSAFQTTMSIDDLRVGQFDVFGPKGIAAEARGSTNSFIVTFNEDIDPATFTASDVLITGPTGSAVSLVGDPVAVDARTFRITFAGNVSGAYAWQIGPDVRDLAGNKMNQDGDIRPNESIEDDYDGTYVLNLGILSIPYFQDFEGGDLSQLAGVSFSTTGDPISLTDLYKPHSGTGHLVLVEGSAVTFAVDLSDQANNTHLGFDFWGQQVTTESFSGELAVSVSGDGLNFVSVPQPKTSANIIPQEYTHFGFDLDAELSAAGIALDGDVYIRIRLATDGFSTVDDVRVSTTDALGPYVVSAEQAGTNDSFTITFDRPIDPATFTAADIVLTGPTGAALSLVHDPIPSADGRTFTLQLPPGLPGQISYAFGGGLQDIYGVALPMRQVRDLNGAPLNQDRDFLVGEFFNDGYQGTYQRHSTPAQTLPYFQDFNSGTLALPGLAYGGSGIFNTSVSSLNAPHGGLSHLRFGPGQSGRQSVTLKLDLSDQVGATNLGIDFWAKLIGKDMPFFFLISGNDIDYFFHQTFAPLSFPATGQYTHFAFDLDEILNSHGIAFDHDVYLKLELANAIANQIMTIDDLRVSTIDQVGPRVVSQTQSSPNNTFQVTFDDPLDPASFTAADVTVIGPTGYPVAVSGNPVPSADLRTYTITVAANVRGAYALQIGPLVSDQAGNLMNQDLDWMNGEASDGYSSTVELLPPSAQTLPYSQDFEGSDFMALAGWSFDASGAKVDLTSASSPHGGAGHLKFTTGVSPGRAILKLDLAPYFGATNLALDFWLQRISQQSDMSLAVSGDGANWTSVAQGADLLPTLGQYTHYVYDLDQALTAASITFDSSVYVRFWHEGSPAAEMSLDDVRVIAGDLFGPKVNDIAWPGAGQALQVTFNEPIDPATFTAADLVLTNPLGVIESAGAPTTTDNRTFLVPVGAITGSYRVVLGPNILDAAGNLMNQDGDPRPGETADDDFEITLNVGAPAAQTLPYVQSFDDTLALPGWSFSTTAVGVMETTSLNAPHSGAKHLQLRQTAASTEQAVLKLDLAAQAGASNLTLDFWLKLLAATTGTFTISASTNGSTWQQLPQGSIALSAALNSYTHFALDLDAALNAVGIPVGGQVYLRLLHTASSASIVIDDLRIGVFDTVGPRAVSMPPIGLQNQFTVTFDKPIDSATLLPALTITGPQGSPVGIIGSPVASADLKSFTFTLADNLTGRYSMVFAPTIRDLAGNLLNQDGDAQMGETSGDQFAATYTIGPPAPRTVPYSQNFEVAALNDLAGWSFSTTGAGTLALTTASPAHSGVKQLLFDRTTTTGTPVAQLAIDLAAQAGRTDLELDFWLQTLQSSSTANSITVGVSGDGTAYTNISNGVSLRTTNGALHFGFDLDAALIAAGIAFDHDVYIQFLHNGTSTSHETAIDDVRVAFEDVISPRVQSITTTITGPAVTVTFTEPIDPATFTASDVSISGGISIVGNPTPTADPRVFTITTSATGPSTFTVTILPDVRDLAGNWLNQDNDAAQGESTEDRFVSGTITWTAPPAQFVPFMQTFDNDALADLRGWSFNPGSGNQILLATSPTPHSGAQQLMFDQGSGGAATQSADLKLNLASLAGRTDLVLDFWVRSPAASASNSSLTLRVSGNGASFTAVAGMVNFAPAQADMWQQFTVDLDAVLAAASVALDADVYLRFEHTGAASQYDLYLDDVHIAYNAVQGPKVSSSQAALDHVSFTFELPIDPASVSAADLAISGPGGSPVAVLGEPTVSADLRTITFVPAVQVPGNYTYTLGPNLTDAFGNLMNQDGDTNRGETNGQDIYTASGSFPTIAAAQVFPYLEGFETPSLFTIPGWSYTTTATAPTSTITATTTGPRSGGYALKFDQVSGSSTSRVAIVKFDMAQYYGAQNLELDFWLKTTGNSGTNVSNSMTVAFSGNGTSFSTFDNGNNLKPAVANEYVHYSFDLDAQMLERSVTADRDIYIRFTHKNDNGAVMLLDDLRLGTADVLGPRLTKSSSGVTAGILTLTFDKPIDPATFTAADIVLTNPGGQVVTGLGQPVPNADNRIYTVALPAGASGTYALRIGPDVRDLAGNAMNQDADPLVGEANGEDDYESTFAFTGEAAVAGSILLSAATVAENAPGAAIGDVSREGSSGTVWNVSDARFEIVGSTLKLKAGQALNYEVTPTLPLTVFASDSAGNTSQEFTIVVTNAVEPPGGIGISNLAVPENSPGAAVGFLNVIDPDAGAAYTLAVSDSRFEIAGNQLKLKSGEVFDFETTTSAISLSITATDQGGRAVSQNFALNVVNVNEAPTNILFSGDTIVENRPAGIVVQIALMALDPDFGDTFTFAVSDNRFEIASAQLRLKPGQPLDFEGMSVVSLTITATDAGGLSIALPLTVTAINQNTAPSAVLLSQAHVLENAPGAVVGNLTAMDRDSGDAHTFAVTDARFEVASNQLKLKPGMALDFENAASISLQVVATDLSGQSKLQSFVIAVDDVSEAPTDIRLSRESLFSGVAGVRIADLAVADQDPGSYSFSVSDPRFEVRERQLFLKPGQAILEPAGASIPLRIHVEDADAGDGFSEDFNLLVAEGPASWAFAHQWLPDRLDVNADGVVTPLDALLVIIELNAFGPGRFSSPPTEALNVFLDASGDNALTPLDALEVINYLNAAAADEARSDFENSVDAALADDPADPAWFAGWWDAGDRQAKRIAS